MEERFAVRCDRTAIAERGVTITWILNFKTQDGGTKMEMDIEYTIPIPVIGKIAEKIVLKRNEREADLAMANIKENMEG